MKVTVDVDNIFFRLQLASKHIGATDMHVVLHFVMPI